MARNRVIYQSELLFVSLDASLTGIPDHEELQRVQSANYGFTVARQDVNEYGQLARIDSLVLDPPTVNADFSYYLTDGRNERALGFHVQGVANSDEGGFASGHLEAGSGKNLFIAVHSEGEDAAQDTINPAPNAIIGIGNSYLSDYTVDLSVGSLPTVTVTMEAANINTDVAMTANGETGVYEIESPAVNTTDGTKHGQECGFTYNRTLYDTETGPKISALRPGDVTLSIENAQNQVLADIGADGTLKGHVQSASISVPLSRSALTKLGTKFDYAKVVDFPVTTSLSVSAVVNEMTANNLVDIIDEAGVTVTVTVNDTAGVPAVRYTMKNVQIDSESFSSSIGSDKSVDMTFTTQIGSSADTVNGVFMSGQNEDLLWDNGVAP